MLFRSCDIFDIEVLGPLRRYDNDNDNSIVLSVEVYHKRFLFTGDIERQAEDDLMRIGRLESDVLKVAHHGSNTSSSLAFLECVRAKDAIISVGASNRYNFPSKELIFRLESKSIQIYRTDQDQTIIYEASHKRRKWVIHLPFKGNI